MSQFEVAQPTWDLPGSLALFDSGTSTVGYWPMAVWSFAAVGQLSTAATALSLIRNAALAIGRAWPFTTADAGELLAIASTSAAAVSWPYATATPF
jgi:hypothetical protein